jgi:hypothetical protein
MHVFKCKEDINMKKLIAVMLIMMLVPISVYAIDAIITDDEMVDVTGQAGIAIVSVGNNVTTFAIENLAWGDGNGHSSDATAGHIRIDGHVTISNTMAGTLTYDVASSGIRIGMPTTNNFAISMPASIRLSCAAGASANWAVTPTDASTVTFGNLGVQTLTVTMTAPTAFILKPH